MYRVLVSLATGIFSSLFATTVLALPINHRDAVVEHLEGKMTASVVKEDSTTIQVQMTTCRVRVAGEHNSIFLYQEQGLVGKLDRPYRQRFLEITTEEDTKDTENTDSELVYSLSYKPENLSQWVNFCDRDLVKRVASQEQLGKLVCRVTLKPLLNVYAGKTASGGCPATFRGAVKITNRIVLHQEGMDTWDRGFDESVNQVWGARDRAYQFRRN